MKQSPATAGKRRFVAQLAASEEDILESLRMRYRIFGGELGANLKTGVAGIDTDRYDAHCRHLVVHDSLTGRMVASTRLLTEVGARAAGGFYSESEFDLGFLAGLPGRKMEVGRTCVDPAFRNGAVIATLWSKLFECVVQERQDFLFGCASIDLDDGGEYARSVLKHLDRHCLSSPLHRSRSYRPLPAGQERSSDATLRLPPLIKAYMSLGAKACGDAYWDQDFNCVDVFMLLDIAAMSPRYQRHFERAIPAEALAQAAA